MKKEKIKLNNFVINFLRDLPVGPNPPDKINVVVEVPAGSANKYEYLEDEGYFILDRVLYSPMFYSFEYGGIPQTMSEDGDTLDVVLFTTYPTFPGCVINARPVGLLLMRDEKGLDRKILAVPLNEKDPRFREIKDIDDIPEHRRKEIKLFFAEYKRLERKKYKFVRVEGWRDKEEAKKEIERAIERFKKQKIKSENIDKKTPKIKTRVKN